MIKTVMRKMASGKFIKQFKDCQRDVLSIPRKIQKEVQIKSK